MADVQSGQSKIPCLRGLFTVTSVGHYLVVSKEVQGEEVMMVGVASGISSCVLVILFLFGVL